MSKHKKISFIKSGLRLMGYMGLSIPSLFIHALLFLVVSELFGIYEEVGEK